MHVLRCQDTVILCAKTLTQNLGMNCDEHYYRKLIFHREYQKIKNKNLLKLIRFAFPLLTGCPRQ